MQHKLPSSCSKKAGLFLGGLPTTISSIDLQKDLRSEFPKNVSFSVILPIDKITRLNKGYAFVTLRNPEHLKVLVGIMVCIQGRSIQLIKAQDPADRKKIEKDTLCRRLFLKGIPWNISDSQLTEAFRTFSDCVSAYAIVDRTGCSRGYGYAMFSFKEEAQRVLTMKKVQIGHRMIEVEEPDKLTRVRKATRKSQTECYDQRQKTSSRNQRCVLQRASGNLSQEHGHLSGRACSGGLARCDLRGSEGQQPTAETLAGVPLPRQLRLCSLTPGLPDTLLTTSPQRDNILLTLPSRLVRIGCRKIKIFERIYAQEDIRFN